MRRLLVPLLAASLLVGPGGAGGAGAAPADCPQAVLDARGFTGSRATIDRVLTAAAAAHDVPLQVVRAVAYVETGWRQFYEDRTPIVSAGPGCRVGMMQVDVAGYSAADQERLALDYAFNVGEGTRVLARMWDQAASTPPPPGSAPDSRDVVENWYEPICLYRGCGSDPTYPDSVANVIADPFRYAPNFGAIPPYWFTKPQDAKPGYVFPGAFQARYSPAREFVFYDPTTGAAETVAAPTHSRSATAPPPAYPLAVTGPDGPGVTCYACDRWAVAPGAGLTGRAHLATTVPSPGQSVVRWAPWRGSGYYDISVYVPVVGDTTLGTATYHADWGRYTVDQDAKKGTWVRLGRQFLSTTSGVELRDGADVPGLPIVADAVRLVAPTSLGLDITYGNPPYGSRTGVRAHLKHYNGGVAGQPVRFYRRPVGRTTWGYVGTVNTDRNGYAIYSAAALWNAEYEARFVPTDGAYVGSRSTVRRVNVQPTVAMSISATEVRRGTAVTVGAAIRPYHAGSRVYLQAGTPTGSKTLGSALLSSTGTVRFRTTPTVAGYHYYAVYLPGHADHIRTYARAVLLRVT